jgi:flagellar biogenesis protein FliO
MDDWDMNPERGKPWRRYVVVGLLAIVAILVAVAYVLSRFAP